MVCTRRHHNLESLKQALVEAVDNFSMDVVHTAINELPKRLRYCIRANGNKPRKLLNMIIENNEMNLKDLISIINFVKIFQSIPLVKYLVSIFMIGLGILINSRQHVEKEVCMGITKVGIKRG